MTYIDILRAPDLVTAQTEDGPIVLQPGGGRWAADDVAVSASLADGRLVVDVTAEQTSLMRVKLRWRADVPLGLRFLGDAWERGYGDLEWRGLVAERVMPWYFLTHDGAATHGYGVRVPPGAFCFWTVDATGVSLWLDVRNGGAGVELGGRTLRTAEVIARRGQPGETAFAAASAFCRQLCDAPRPLAQPVYGANDWYYAYGKNSHAGILADAGMLAELAPAGDNRPFMVIDAGWQPMAGDVPADVICGGPYAGANARFPDMPGLAAAIRATGARPGIWIRPLAAEPDTPGAILLPEARAEDRSAKRKVLDPSLPEVLAQISANFRTLNSWGYDLIKHDWSACDLLGRWGYKMGTALTNPGWRFADRSRTNAEIATALYRAIREGAGDAVVIGCNAFGHLGAGLFDLQRVGDDTSGREWERTRKMGVNTLAFRMPQHGAFFAADADCVGDTGAMPWTLNRQFLDLMARSGTPLFVSFNPGRVTAEQKAALRAALAAAAQPRPAAEPLDWLDTTCPQAWRLGDEVVRYDWYGDTGAVPG
jgi:alpha-galactosidase